MSRRRGVTVIGVLGMVGAFLTVGPATAGGSTTVDGITARLAGAGP